MRKPILWGLAVVLLLPVALIALLLLLPASLLKGPASAALGKALGRDVEIAGDFEFSLFNPTRFEANGVRIADAAWRDRTTPLFATERVVLELDTGRLTDGVLAVRRLDFNAPELHLARDEAGKWNLPTTFGGGSSNGGKPASGWGLQVERVRVAGGGLTIDGPGRERPRRFDRIAFLAQAADGGALTFEGRAVGATGPATIEGRIDDVAAIKDGTASPVEADLKAPGGRARVEGRVGGEPVLDLRVEAETEAPADLARWAGDDVALPERLPRAATLTTDLKGDTTRFALDKLRLKTDELDVNGALDVALKGRPKVAGRLDLGEVAVGRVGPDTGEDSSGQDGWPEREIAWPVPLPLDLDVDLAFDRLTWRDVDLRDGAGHLFADDRAVRLRVGAIETFGGKVAGMMEAVREAKGPPSLRLELDGDDFEMGPIAAVVAPDLGLSGRGKGKLDLTASGASIADLVRNLNGDVRLVTDGVEAKNEDALGMVRQGLALLTGAPAALDPKGPPARVEIDVAVQDGVARSKTLRVDLIDLKIDGDATANLPERRIEARLTPITPEEGQSGQSNGANPLGGLLPGSLASLLAAEGGLMGAGLFDDVVLVADGPWQDIAYSVELDGKRSGDLRDSGTLEKLGGEIATKAQGRLGEGGRQQGAEGSTQQDDGAVEGAIEDAASQLLDRLLNGGKP